MTTSSILTKIRSTLSPAHKATLDAFENHAAVRAILDDAERDVLAARRIRIAALAAVGPRFEKPLAAAVQAAAAAVTEEASTAAAAHRARVALQDCQAAAMAIAATRDQEIQSIRDDLADSAAPIVIDALAAAYGISMNQCLPDLHGGDLPQLPPAGYGWGEYPPRIEAPGLPEWHRASAVRLEVIAALDAMRYEALSDAEAAEAVTIQLRKISAALAPLKGGTYSINKDGLIVRNDPVTHLTRVYGAAKPSDITVEAPK